MNRKSVKRSGFLVLTGLAMLLGLMVGWLLWQQLQLSSVEVLRHQITDNKFWFAITRWGLMLSIVLYWFWPVGDWIRSSSRQINTGALTNPPSMQQQKKWRMVGWLVGFELVIGQALPAKILQWLAG